MARRGSLGPSDFAIMTPQERLEHARHQVESGRSRRVRQVAVVMPHTQEQVEAENREQFLQTEQELQQESYRRAEIQNAGRIRRAGRTERIQSFVHVLSPAGRRLFDTLTEGQVDWIISADTRVSASYIEETARQLENTMLQPQISRVYRGVGSVTEDVENNCIRYRIPPGFWKMGEGTYSYRSPIWMINGY